MDVPLIVVAVAVMAMFAAAATMPHWAIRGIYRDRIRRLQDDLLDHVHLDEDLPDCPASEELVAYVDATLASTDILSFVPLVFYRLVQQIPSLTDAPAVEWADWPVGADRDLVDALYDRYEKTVTRFTWFGSYTGLIAAGLLIVMGVVTLKPFRFWRTATTWTFALTRQVAGNPRRYVHEDRSASVR